MKIKGFSYQTLQLKKDYEGVVEATFITAADNTGNRPSVLYVHGFIDYFFHPHLSDFFTESGYDFYALELRKYGHSILPHQHPNYCRSMEEYFEELDASISIIRERTNQPIFLLGHSTGGLLTSLYLNKGKYKNLISGLILNSPFLEVNMPKKLRKIMKPLSNVVSRIFSFAKITGMLTPIYPKSVHKNYNGEWDFDETLKPILGFPVYFAWSKAIMEAQDELKENSAIPCPVLLLHSSDSYLPILHEQRVFEADIVLNVNDMKEIGPKLGPNVKLVEIAKGMHDLFLSPEKVRNQAFQETKTWLQRVIDRK